MTNQRAADLSHAPSGRNTWAHSFHAWPTIVGILLCALTCGSAAAPPNAKNILILFSSIEGSPNFMNVLEPAMRGRVHGPINFQISYLVNREGINQDSFYQSQAQTLRRGYAAVKLDLVIAVAPQALLFSLRYRDEIFPGVPIVFTQVGTREFQGRTWPGVTGLMVPVGIGETIDLALRLHPDTTTVALIGGHDWYWGGVVHSELLRYGKTVKEVVYNDDASRDLLAQVLALPPHTVVLFHIPLPAESRPEFGNRDLLAGVSQRWPTYSAWPENCLDHGCIGGASPDLDKEHLATAEIASRVLLGERPEDIPIEQDSRLEVRVDWRELQRWRIAESKLPPGSVVLYREPTLWQRYRGYVVAVAAVMIVQALLIAALLWQRTRRRRAEAELLKSEEKFSKAFRHSPLAVSIVRARDGHYLDVNEIFEAQTGWRRDEVVGRTSLEISLWVDPAQRTAFMSRLMANGHVRDQEARFRRKDGQIRTGVGSAEVIELNSEQCAVSVIADITERKQAEEAMANFSGRLIEAQEAERTRIARELHDDINQRLALLAISLKTAKEELPASEARTNDRLAEAAVEIDELASDIQALSHRLHSSKLEYLGLEAAASGFCREISERQNVMIDFRSDDIPRGLSNEVALCLFRVLQEALHNAVKYSGVDAFKVSLSGASGGIELRVHDSGAGFAPASLSNGHGLGLISMKERLRSVNGELVIQSKPGQGTTILARVQQ